MDDDLNSNYPSDRAGHLGHGRYANPAESLLLLRVWVEILPQALPTRPLLLKQYLEKTVSL